MEHQRELYQQRGYSEDLLPKTETQRNWKAFNYFTLWMGSVHNVPNYVMVGGFFILGLSTFNIMLAIIISALFIAAAMVMNGAAGSKYGVPFAMILRGSYGVRGALFLGLLRGGIAAIMWFGLQCYAGSLAFLILIGKIWPGFLTLGGDFKLLGLSLPGLITFLIFWIINVGIGFGGGKVLNKFTAILNPCIYIVFGGMAIWAISLVGIGPILDYLPSGVQKAEHSGFLFLVVINAVVAVWAAPAVSASDFTQNAHSFRAQAYFVLDTDQFEEIGTLAKCSPPIRDQENQKGMWEKLFNGEIDCLVSDHSPCPPEMKAGNIMQAWGGIAGLQNCMDVMFDEAVQKRGMSLPMFGKLMATNAADIFGLKHKGRIAPGKDADLVFIQPDSSYVLKNEDLEYRHKVSPYVGRTIGARITKTILRGDVIYDIEHGFPVPPKGQFILKHQQ
ncbi:TPA: amidohydrolase family protein [Salmonella enterica]|uniref:Amidohydrolase family protein n=1 Tax=Salmonella enterica TaxID=28901 RepID=A0A754DX90_SALER|nr:amidohydrolase family protein [Salmonella enterica subsp. enterica serovar Abortusequi]EFQ9517618.1 amidohydrolase family protein [Salmonella enterica]EFR7364472.1 amidohydrolase family protein [Salmonella enterica]HAA0790751.1 amidohydrolase family protein [Salmonella enterica]HAF8567164.1 amidohydrolase family protein [Salmonella enterica]